LLNLHRICFKKIEYLLVMRNLLCIFTAVILSSYAVFAQQKVIPLNGSKLAISIKQSTLQQLRVSVSFSSLVSNEVVAKSGEKYVDLVITDGFSTGLVGTPKLPAFKKLIQIPLGARPIVKVHSYSHDDILLGDYGITYPVIPVQPPVRKDQDPDSVQFVMKAEVYRKNRMIEPQLVKVDILGTMRGVQVARLEVNPVAYNPVTGMLRIFNDIDVEVDFEGAGQPIHNDMLAKTASPYFESSYSCLINDLTKSSFDDHPDLTTYPVKMLIVTNRMFEATLAPFIEWKTKKGFTVEVAYTDVIGSKTDSIKTFIHNTYTNATPENPAPTFLVLVGDVAQVPASGVGSASGKQTDLYYASVDGDYFPEMYYGRMSATTTAHLQNIIDKILYYEQYRFEDPTYLDAATLIAGADAIWNPKVGQPTIKYGTKYYFNSTQGYSNIYEYGVTDDPYNLDAQPGYSGCYDPDQVAVGFINYTAHCSETSWADPNLTSSAVEGMTNLNRYPLAIGNCCLSGDFATDECIGEKWIRAAGKGAVTYIGSSPSTYWFEDFYWSVGAFPLVGDNNGYVPTYEGTTLGAYDAPHHSSYVTTGGIVFAGNLAVTEVDAQEYPQQSSPQYYWEAYNILGDPSLIPYFTQASSNAVSHTDSFPIGLSFYTISALPGSYVAISKDGLLHGAALVDDSGEVEVPVNPILDGGDVDIVITRPQTIPYMVRIPAAALDGPYITLDSYTVEDENAKADFGEKFTIAVTLKNIGVDTANTVSARLSGVDRYVTITDGDSVYFGSIHSGEPGNTSTVAAAFELAVADSTPDGYVATFNFDATDGTNTWPSKLKITVNSPKLSVKDFTLVGDNNSNGQLDPGEKGQFRVLLSNQGHADAGDALVILSDDSPFLNINNSSKIVSLPLNSDLPVDFDVSASSGTFVGTEVNATAKVSKGAYTAEGNYHFGIGDKPEVRIGTDSLAAGGTYPFDSFYKANRSQILFKKDEIAANPKTIKSVGFYFTQVGEINPFTNLKIKLLETELSYLGTSYVNTDSATLVFNAVSYTMPTISGWHVFDIEDFRYTATANLLVEVSFGINSNYESNAYEVACTSTDFTSVAYGYDDYQPLPAFDANSSRRPNIYLKFGFNDFPNHSVSGLIFNNDLPVAIPDANVTMQGFLTYNKTSDENGKFSVDSLLVDRYILTVTGKGFVSYSDTLTVDGDMMLDTIKLSSASYPVTFSVYANGEAVEGAEIVIEGYPDFLYTNSLGVALTSLKDGDYSYNVTKTGYNPILGNIFTVSGGDKNVDILLFPLSGGDSKLGAAAVYPNPFSSYLRIGGVAGVEYIKLTSLTGQVAMEFRGNGSETYTLNTANLPAGFYLITLELASGEKLVKKVIKQ